MRRPLKGDQGLSGVATELGIGTGQLRTWRTEHLAAGSAETLAARKAEEAETQRFKREVKRLEEDNLILRRRRWVQRHRQLVGLRLQGHAMRTAYP